MSGSYDSSLRFWDLATWRCMRKAEGHADAVRVLAAADSSVVGGGGGGWHVFSGSYDGSVGLWLWWVLVAMCAMSPCTALVLC